MDEHPTAAILPSGVKGSELIDTVVIDTVTPWWTAHMAKESLSRYAPRAWGMQPNTSLAADLPRFPWAAFHSCLYTAYYTISGMSAAFSSHHRGNSAAG